MVPGGGSERDLGIDAVSSGKGAAGVVVAAVLVVVGLWFSLPSPDEVPPNAREGGTHSERRERERQEARAAAEREAAARLADTKAKDASGPPSADAAVKPGESPTPADPAEPTMGRGLDHPLLALMDSGQSFTADAAKQPDMRGISPNDPKYDPIVDADQLFHGFEEALRAARPLDATRFRKLVGEWKERNRGVLDRAQELRKAGHPEASRAVMEEWSRLWGIYQAEAYGRAPPPSAGL